MLIGIHNLIENNRISYDVLDQMIRADLIKNIFVKTGDGAFRAVRGIKEIEYLYNMQCEHDLEDYVNSINFAKDDFKRECKKYKEQYKDIKRRYYNKWTGEGLDVCREKINEIMKQNMHTYDTKKYNLNSEMSRYKNAKERQEAEKNRKMYFNIFLFKIEYEQATEAYVKDLLTNGGWN